MESTWCMVADQQQATFYQIKGSRRQPAIENIEVLDGSMGDIEDSAAVSGEHFMLDDHSGREDELQRRFVRR